MFKVRWIRLGRPLLALALTSCLGMTPHHEHVGLKGNLPLPTLGGMQFWADLEWRAGWRLQENVLFRHCRVLDPGNVRRAWGGRDACHSALVERTPTPAPIEHLAVLLHGLGRSRRSMVPVAKTLSRAGFEVANLSYPSTRAGLEEHARNLNELLDRLPGVERVSFVTHSMGGIVLRRALAEPSTWRDRIRLGRAVQLGPPNRGSQLARRLRYTPLAWLFGACFKSVAGTGVLDLPALPCEALVIAGGRSDGRGWNPLVRGDDDGIVAVAETVLEDAGGPIVVRALHTFLMGDEKCLATLREFLVGPSGPRHAGP